MGKSIGGTLGLPVEGRLGPHDFTFYDPVPVVAPPNDDLELQLVWLDLVEKCNGQLFAGDFGRAWLRHIHYMWDEYGRCRWNLRRGISPEASGSFENPFHAGMGSPIRSEIWACLFPEDSASAAYYAGLDASLDHGTEGIAGEVFFAVMQSFACAGIEIEEAIGEALRAIPDRTETFEAISLIHDLHRKGIEPWSSRRQLLEMHDNENFTHGPLNVALAVWAILSGAGDFERSVLLSVNAGYDTDSTAATVGATLGLMLGIENLPGQWKEPIGDGIYLGLGIRDLPDAPSTLRDLTTRVGSANGRLARKERHQVPWTPAASPALENLPGTIWMRSCGGNEAAWANGELPEEVKQCGEGEWEWEVRDDSPKGIICLAPQGADLYVDGRLALRCEPGRPYVPATHRCPDGTRTFITPGPGTYHMKVELTSHDRCQSATVLLTYPDLHICPWTAEDLPNRAMLPANQ